jgi:hypothetical protein
VADNSLRGVDIRSRTITGSDIARRTLQASHFRRGVLRAGAQGPAGPKGEPGVPGARGPSFADGRQVRNMTDIACNAPVVVGSQSLTVREPSRVWTHGHGALRDNGSAATEFALFLRLRDAVDTATLASTFPAWDATIAIADDPVALTTGGVLQRARAPRRWSRARHSLRRRAPTSCSSWRSRPAGARAPAPSPTSASTRAAPWATC